MSSQQNEVIELIMIMKTMITNEDNSILRSFLDQNLKSINDTIYARMATNLLYICTAYPHLIPSCVPYFPSGYELDENYAPNQKLAEAFVQTSISSFYDTENYKEMLNSKLYLNPSATSTLARTCFSKKLKEINSKGYNIFTKIFTRTAKDDTFTKMAHITRTLYDYPNMLFHFTVFLDGESIEEAHRLLQWPRNPTYSPLKIEETKNRLSNVKAVIDFILSQKEKTGEYPPINIQEYQEKIDILGSDVPISSTSFMADIIFRRLSSAGKKYVTVKSFGLEPPNNTKLEPSNSVYLAPYPSYQVVEILPYDLSGFQVSVDQSYDLLDNPEPRPISKDPQMQKILDDVINIRYYSAPRVPIIDVKGENYYNETRKKAIREYDESYCPVVIKTVEEERMVYHIHMDRSVVLITKIKHWVLSELNMPLTAALSDILSLNPNMYDEFVVSSHFFDKMPVIYMNHIDELFTKDSKNTQPIIHYCYKKPMKAALVLLAALKNKTDTWMEEYAKSNPLWSAAFARANYLQLDRESLIIEKAQKSMLKAMKLQKDFFSTLARKKELMPDGNFDMCLPSHWQMNTDKQLFRSIDSYSVITIDGFSSLIDFMTDDPAAKQKLNSPEDSKPYLFDFYVSYKLDNSILSFMEKLFAPNPALKNIFDSIFINYLSLEKPFYQYFSAPLAAIFRLLWIFYNRIYQIKNRIMNLTKYERIVPHCPGDAYVECSTNHEGKYGARLPPVNLIIEDYDKCHLTWDEVAELVTAASYIEMKSQRVSHDVHRKLGIYSFLVSDIYKLLDLATSMANSLCDRCRSTTESLTDSEKILKYTQEYMNNAIECECTLTKYHVVFTEKIQTQDGSFIVLKGTKPSYNV